MNGPAKFMKMIKIFVLIYVIVFTGFFIFTLLFDSDMKYIGIEMTICTALIIGFVVFIVVYGLKVGKEYNKNLKATKTKHRFKYLDTFYYPRKDYHGVDDTITIELVVYEVIQDTNSNKIYAIGESGTNVRFQKVLDETKLLRIDNMEKITTRKDWKEVDFNDVGSFWIDEELVDCYQNDGTKIILSYLGQKEKIKVENMFNRNKNYDVSLLDKATFITGYVEFDAKN